MNLHSVRDIDLFCHMNDITDCRTVEYAYRQQSRLLHIAVCKQEQPILYYILYISGLSGVDLKI